MKRYLLFIFVSLVAGSVLYQCAPKASKSKTTESHQEDLSPLRPLGDVTEVDSSQTVESALSFDRGPYAPPVSDVNVELDAEVARISSQQSKMPILIYTVQVYTGRSREEANQARSTVYQALPDENPQLTYQQPNYKVRVGTYYERADAYLTFKTLKEKFPGAILVPVRVLPGDIDSDSDN